MGRGARAFAGGVVGACLALASLASLASCSLLAPSDEEAMAGLTEAGDTSTTNDGNAVVEAGRETGPDASVETGSIVCPGCQVACNEGQCSACYLNGAPCRSNAECCGGICNAQSRCGASAGACAADNSDCTITPDSCCAGLTCSAERGSRCEACRGNGENCKGDTDCCSLDCNGSTCASCIATGTTGCTRARQCCSGVCNAGTCG